MSHPRIDKVLREHPITKIEEPDTNLSPEEVTNPRLARERATVEKIRHTVSPEYRLDLPVVSAAAIIDQAKDYPLVAAYYCRKGFYLLETGHQRQLRHYIAAAYAITCSIRDSERHLKSFAAEVRDGRSKAPPSVEKVTGNLLQLVFRHIFAEGGAATRNRAYQYAYGLQDSYNLGKSVDEVGLRVMKCGPEKLYRAAAKRARLIEAAKELEASGREPATITEDELLSDVATEQFEESTDFGWRELPPDDDEWLNEINTALNEPMPLEAYDEDDGIIDVGDVTDDSGDDDDAEQECLLRAESRIALLAKTVIELELGLNELRSMLRAL